VSKRKLLLADDSITIQKVVNLTFADEGIEVIPVGDGDSAMRKFDEFMPDLVMADVNMPGLNGYEVCRIIKNTEETRHIPVILLVGSFEPFDEEEAKSVGADDFLTKPFQSIRQLVNKVTDLLNQREQVSEESPAETQTAVPTDSFADTLEFEKKDDEAPTEFGDAGMDDEMIETTPANGFVSNSESDFQAETSIDYAKTQPLNSEDLKGFDIVQTGDASAGETPENAADENQYAIAETTEEPFERAEAATFDEEARKLQDTPGYDEPEAEEASENTSETEPQIDYYLPVAEEEEFEKELTDAETLAPEVSYSAEEERTPDFSQAPADESSETAEVEETNETGQVEETSETGQVEETPEAETGYLGESETEAPEPAESDLTEKTETEETPGTETFEETKVSAPVSPPSLNFDDGDLLELPPLVEETGIRPQAQVKPLKSEPEPEPAAETEPEVAKTETTETWSGETQSTAENASMQSFPPELIEAIAQRVAEKISDRTMKDVLPQITKLVMQKMAEENLKNED
jgi:CheY-like chemotaxis protein